MSRGMGKDVEVRHKLTHSGLYYLRALSIDKTLNFTKRDLTQKVAEKLDVPYSQMVEPVTVVCSVSEQCGPKWTKS